MDRSSNENFCASSETFQSFSSPTLLAQLSHHHRPITTDDKHKKKNGRQSKRKKRTDGNQKGKKEQTYSEKRREGTRRDGAPRWPTLGIGRRTVKSRG